MMEFLRNKRKKVKEENKIREFLRNKRKKEKEINRIFQGIRAKKILSESCGNFPFDSKRIRENCNLFFN